MMKKVLIIVIAFLVVFVTGCANNANSESDSIEVDLDLILVVDNGQLSEAEDLNYKNLISIKPQYFLSDAVKLEKQISVNNVEHGLKYKDSLYYPIGCRTVHRYIVDGNEESTLLIDEDGNIKSILYSYTTLNINGSASPAELLEPLKVELSKILDITYYKNVKLPNANQDANGFGIYSYVFYNVIGNYMTDYLKVSISDDGSVFGLSINNSPLVDFKLSIDTEKENLAIESKLKEIYNTDTTQYKSYNIAFDPCIVQYNDQVYIQYILSTNYLHTQYGEMSSYLNTILIPVDDISR